MIRDAPDRPPGDFFVQPPAVSLPKGGGAIRGVGEKFTANAATGSGSFALPLPAPAGRSGFGPELALTYDSASGNGPFGFGWQLPVPAITRKTDKGVPRYLDDRDVYLLSGAEDLVPQLDALGRITPDTTSVAGYRITRFLPRIEGLFARIERWMRVVDGDVHWRSISSENVLTVYGRDARSRVTAPDNPSHVFSWLIAETRDDRGNAIVYDYAPEDGNGIDLTQAHERSRGDRPSRARRANRYLTRIRYANRTSLLDAAYRRPPDLTDAAIAGTEWHFELLFDYGERGGFEAIGDETWTCQPDLAGAGEWPVRADPFSTYRAGFEIRTYRLCRRVLLLHHFSDQPEIGAATLVKSLDLRYRTGPQNAAASDPGFTFLERAAQRSYQRDGDAGRYRYRSLPPIDFTYSDAIVDDRVRDVDPATLENVPIGIGETYRWMDLDGEGIPGVLTESAGGGWYYKANDGPGPAGPRLSPMRAIERPATATLASGRQQLMDVQANGQLDVVDLSPPLAGYYERDANDGWRRFVPFPQLPQIDWTDRNLRFVDLTGDGLADALVTEEHVFTWYQSAGELGFDAAQRTATALDERDGPRLVFDDGEETIYLADMSGDGLADLVRIRHSSICYWPNLGHGRFGAQIVMDGSPLLDRPGLFDQRRVRLADVDGSGVTDLIYLGAAGARVWFNRSGNAWSAPRDLPFPAATANVDQIQVADLFGSGTACLVWSSALPGEPAARFRYLDLMGRKPYLLVEMRNNLGAITRVTYTPSTAFYLSDKHAGRPWATRLPFPVHCVATITVRDAWRKAEFSTHYRYRHGFFDGVEREFRGFGCVEQIDVQRFDEFSAANGASAFVTSDRALHQAPVKTVTWFHTGVALERALFTDEYSRDRDAAQIDPAPYAAAGVPPFAELAVPLPLIDEGGDPALTADEWREAMRACKGAILRQETYDLDLDAWYANGSEVPVRLVSAAQHAWRIRRLQARGSNQHAVFVRLETEIITYHYELDLRSPLAPDPRIAHALNLRFDDFGRVLQSFAIGYPRWLPHRDVTLSAEQLELIHRTQRELHVAYAETRFTSPLAFDAGAHRLPAACESLTFELTGIPRADPVYFRADDFRVLDLSDAYAPVLTPDETATAVTEIPYEQVATGGAKRRLVARQRTLYFDGGPGVAQPVNALAFGRHDFRCLPYQSYRLALTATLLDAVFKERTAAGAVVDDKLTWQAIPAAAGNAAVSARGLLDAPELSGYVPGTSIEAALTGQYWIPSGTAGFSPGAARAFYLPARYLDAFGRVTTLEYDTYRLAVAAVTDTLGNRSAAEAIDYRILAPRRLRDANANVSEVAFDILGLPVAMALLGKAPTGAPPESGDTVAGFTMDDLNPDPVSVAAFFAATDLDGRKARDWLATATARFVYHLGEAYAAGAAVWASMPAAACSISREHHERDAPNVTADRGDPARRIAIHTAFAYSDGAGQIFVTKTQAEPDPADATHALRWIANGKAVVNNKGKPVLQYEPYFSTRGHRYEESAAVGVTPALFYDAEGRLVRTELPDGTIARVEFSPWLTRSFDQHDTVLDPGNRWYALHTAAAATADEKRAARLAALHANTPSTTILDSLGRSVALVAHNRTPSDTPADVNVALPDRSWLDDRQLTFTKLDAEGKPLWVCDARGNLVVQHVIPPKPDHTPIYDPPNPNAGPAYDMPAGAIPCYDIAGNTLFQRSMDGGNRWMLSDATGQPLAAWDANQFIDDGGNAAVERRFVFQAYDAGRRPVEQWLTINRGARRLVEAFAHVDTSNFVDALGNVTDAPGLADALRRNAIGQTVEHWDASGLVTVDRIDFAGRPLAVRRTLIADPTALLIDWSGDRAAQLDAETFIQLTEYDALGRTTRLYNWHRDDSGRPGQSSRVAVYEPRYNERQLLTGETLHLRVSKQTDPQGRVGFTADTTRSAGAIESIAYDAKGQRLAIAFANGTITTYGYDPETFRLVNLRTPNLQDLQFTYDAAGNVVHVQDDAQQTVYFANQQVEPSADYTYDALYKLIEGTGRENAAATATPDAAEGPWPTARSPAGDATRRYTERYHYDAAGNLRQLTHTASVAAGNWTLRSAIETGSNRLFRTWYGDPDWNAAAATGKTEYRHDQHGNMLNLAATAPGLDVRWDRAEMIRSLDLQGGGWVYYSYGSDKQRARKRHLRNGGVIEDRIYLGDYELYRRHTGDPAHPVEEIESHHLSDGRSRVLLVDDVLSTNRMRPDGLTVTRQTLWRYQYGNHLGSVTAELDDAAQLISYEEYRPYGACAYRLLESRLEAPPKRYRFTGMERDEESGLDYHGARFYLLTVGRWISTDPSDTSDGLNLYAYCLGNPASRTDPTGEASDDLEAALGAIARYQDQLRRGPNKIAEHVIPHKLVQYLMRLDPNDNSEANKFLRSVLGKSLITDADYNQATTIIWDKYAANLKTYGSSGDLAHIRAVRDLVLNNGSADALKELDKAAANALSALEKSGTTVTQAELRAAMVLQTVSYSGKGTFRIGFAQMVARHKMKLGLLGIVIVAGVVLRPRSAGAEPAAELPETTDYPLKSTEQLKAEADTPDHATFAAAISRYASLEIRWAIEDEVRLAHPYAPEGGPNLLGFVPVIGFLLDSSPTAAPVSESPSAVEEIQKRVNARITALKATLAKNDVTLTPEETHVIADAMYNPWHLLPGSNVVFAAP